MAALRTSRPRSSTSTTKHKLSAVTSDTLPAMSQQHVLPEDPLPLPPILRLPEELRTAIWRLCLTADAPIQWPESHLHAGLTPGLLRVCKSVNKEATPILYRRNTLAYQHPSDCNMFGWAHSTKCLKDVYSVALHIRDQDARLWASYLSSSNIHRSLIADFPSLQILNITFRARYWAAMDGSPLDKFQNWSRDTHLKELCEILKDKTSEGTKVHILAVHRVPSQDIHFLAQLPQLREHLTFNHNCTEARTGYRWMARAEVALELRQLSANPM